MNKYNIKFLLVLTFLSAIGGFLFGYTLSQFFSYDTGVIGGANLFIHYDISPYSDTDKEIVTSITTLGAAVGALLGGPFSDYCGRKPAIFLGDALFVAGSVILALAGSIAVLIIGRLVLGFGVGIAAMVVPIYLSESAPSAVRGRIVTVNILFIVLGQFLAYLICYALDTRWRWMLGIAAAPAVIQAFGMLFMPESPRWLLKVSRYQKAVDSMRRMFNTDNSDALSEMNLEIDQIKHALQNEGHLSFKQQISKLFRTYWKGVLVGVMLQVWQQLAGINTALYYGPNIIEDAGFGGEGSGEQHDREVLLYSLPLSGINFLFTIVTLFVIDKYGRRYIMLRTLPFIAFFMWCLAASFAVIKIYDKSWGQWLALTSICLFLAAFAIGMGSTPWTVNSEIYPLPLRATANALATTANWLANYAVTAVFLTAVKSNAGTVGVAHFQVATYAVIGGFSVCAFVFIYFLLPETKGKTLPEIESYFRSGPKNTSTPSEQYGRALTQQQGLLEHQNPPLVSDQTKNVL